VLPLLELFLSEVAVHHRVAMLVDAIDEVLASHADHATFPVLQVALVEVVPLLDSLVSSTYAPAVVRRFWQR